MDGLIRPYRDTEPAFRRTCSAGRRSARWFWSSDDELLRLPAPEDAQRALVSSVANVLAFCVENPGRFHLSKAFALPEPFEPDGGSSAGSAASHGPRRIRFASAGSPARTSIVLRWSLDDPLGAAPAAPPFARHYCLDVDECASRMPAVLSHVK